jgi:hypothetical protein
VAAADSAPILLPLPDRRSQPAGLALLRGSASSGFAVSLLLPGDIAGLSIPLAIAKQGLLIAGAPVKADEMPHELQELAVGLSLLFVHESLQDCETPMTRRN